MGHKKRCSRLLVALFLQDFLSDTLKAGTRLLSVRIKNRIQEALSRYIHEIKIQAAVRGTESCHWMDVRCCKCVTFEVDRKRRVRNSYGARFFPPVF